MRRRRPACAAHTDDGVETKPDKIASVRLVKMLVRADHAVDTVAAKRLTGRADNQLGGSMCPRTCSWSRRIRIFQYHSFTHAAFVLARLPESRENALAERVNTATGK